VSSSKAEGPGYTPLSLQNKKTNHRGERKMQKTLWVGLLVLAGTISAKAWTVPGSELAPGKGLQITRNGRYFGMANSKEIAVTSEDGVLVLDLSNLPPKQIRPFFIHAVTPKDVIPAGTLAGTELNCIFKVDIACENSPADGALRLTGEDKNQKPFHREVNFKPSETVWELKAKLASDITKIGAQIKLSSPGVYKISNISITAEALK
jgi:hypothetical protein